MSLVGTRPPTVDESMMEDMRNEAAREYVSLPVSLFGEGEFFILRASGDL